MAGGGGVRTPAAGLGSACAGGSLPHGVGASSALVGLCWLEKWKDTEFVNYPHQFVNRWNVELAEKAYFTSLELPHQVRPM